jgi:hypothetical protein
MASEKEAQLRELARQLLDEAGDDAVAEKIFNEEKTARRKRRDAPIPRPQLKFEVQREGSTLKHREEIFDMFADMNARGIPDDVQVATVLTHFQKHHPGDVSRSSLFELIDGSSDCTYPRNKKRLLEFLKRTKSS